MRLPVTTGYADKICKNRDFVPDGKMDDRLFFCKIWVRYVAPFL